MLLESLDFTGSKKNNVYMQPHVYFEHEERRFLINTLHNSIYTRLAILINAHAMVIVVTTIGAQIWVDPPVPMGRWCLVAGTLKNEISRQEILF